MCVASSRVNFLTGDKGAGSLVQLYFIIAHVRLKFVFPCIIGETDKFYRECSYPLFENIECQRATRKLSVCR